MAAAGVPDIKERLLEGYQAGDKHFRVHLDGYNQLPYLTGETDESPRHEFYYYGEREVTPSATTTGRSTSRPRTTGSAGRWSGPRCRDRSTCGRPLRAAHGRAGLPAVCREKLWTVLPAAAIVQQHVASFTEFPPRQAPPGFNPRQWSKRCSRPPPSAKETSNGGRQDDDMLLAGSR